METNLALYFSTLPSVACFILYILLEETIDLYFGLATISQTLFFMVDLYSYNIEYFQTSNFPASSKKLGLESLMLITIAT